MHQYFIMRRFIIVILITFSVMPTALAVSKEDAYSTPDRSIMARSDVVMPILSFFLPGFGQWTRSQYGYGTIYSGVAIGGLSYYANASHDIDEHDQKDQDALSSKSISQRKAGIGLQTYQVAGGYSLFHTFRTAARLRQAEGQYEFLKSDPQPGEIALAPFHFQYLVRPTTYIPLVVGAGLNIWIVNQQPPDGWVRDAFRKEDAAFTAGYSYNAGTHEEAVFRGGLMPMLREYGMNDPWSNGVQAVAFGAAHLGNTPLPLVQLILGWHFGSITQKSNWDMREAVFIHAWWDVFAFAAQYRMKKQNPDSKTVARLHLPPLTYAF